MPRYLAHPDDIPVELTFRHSSSLYRRHLHTQGLGGIACLQARAYRRGTAVEVLIPSLGVDARYPGYVAWCQRLDVGYRVGVAFTDSETLFGARMGEQVCQIHHYCQLHASGQLGDSATQQLAAQWVTLNAEAFSEASLRAGPV
ncbi:PilZ domain-containing protein [Pseudomonas sp. SWRI107]|uniref:PilZ domain-containing protein n=1 Tax=Pseudomonas TaxID=286 RepID=UPI00164446CB|nr:MULTISPECIES: PilZ domain-containing protein [Pseudomonas]MBC3411881.1 PilZ domain-containing protein [Pseudomonas sp. SWRI51]MBV4533808.1 PilZ domain-containing protein [Pseudomonas farsensis]